MMSSKVDRRVRTAAAQHVERLEDRCLLSATKISDVPAQAVITANGPTQVTLSTFLNDPTINGGTVIQMQTPLGNIPLELTDAQTPLTVANFVNYVNSGEYTPTIIQRLAAGFVIQGGGTKPDGTNNNAIGTLNSSGGTVIGEPHFSNTTGTIAMALSQGMDSATNQWFINLANNTPLDTGDGGPFTVFGQVIDGGMTVVNNIANLSTINGGAENGNWAVQGAATLPVLPGYTGPTTLVAGSPIPTSDLVTDNIVVIPGAQAAPQYTVVSADPSIITASVANGVMTLNAAPGVTSGSTTVTATVTDIGGETASSTFTVGVNGFTIPVTLGAGGAKSVTYTDADGTTGVLTLSGPGSATVNFQSLSALTTASKHNQETVSGSGASLASISTTGTTSKSTLTITTRGGTHSINIGDITTDSLKSINGRGATLAGNLTSTGTIGSLLIAGAQGGSIAATSIGTLTATGTFSDNLHLAGGVSLARFTAGSIAGGSWGTSGSATTISAKSISNWSPVFTGSVTTLSSTGDLSGVISASSIKTLRVGGTLDATISVSGSIGSATVHKDLSSSIFQVLGSGLALGRLTVGGSITGSLISVAGSIGPVSATSLAGSKLYAGVANLAANQVLPNISTDFATPESIASVSLKTLSSGDSFSNSAIAATSLPKLSLGTILTSNGGMVEGVASEAIGVFTAKANGNRISLKKVTSSTDLSGVLPELAPDFVIKLF